MQFFALLLGVKDWRARRDMLLERVALAEFRDRQADRLSGGMRQKLALACSLMHSPDILLLDEPTTGVDPVTRREFWRLLADLVAEGLTLVIATPYLDEAERCSRVVLMHQGRVLADAPPGELRALLPGVIVEVDAQPSHARGRGPGAGAGGGGRAAFRGPFPRPPFVRRGRRGTRPRGAGRRRCHRGGGARDPRRPGGHVPPPHRCRRTRFRGGSMRKQLTARSEQCVGAALAAAKGGGKPHPYPCFALVIILALLTGPVAAETIKLDADAVAARAVEVSHVAAAAAARLSATQETVKAADAAALPSLSLSASLAQRSSVPEFAAPINGPLQPPVVLNPDITTTYGTGLRLQQALYSGGAITGQREATRHDGQASAANLATTVADLRLSAQLAYWEAVRAAASVGVARAQEERAKRLLDDTQALFDAGMAVNADVLAAKERIASAHVQADRRADRGRQRARHAPLLAADRARRPGRAGGLPRRPAPRSARDRRRAAEAGAGRASRARGVRRADRGAPLAPGGHRCAGAALRRGRRPVRLRPSQPPVLPAAGPVERLVERRAAGLLDALRRRKGARRHGHRSVHRARRRCRSGTS